MKYLISLVIFSLSFNFSPKLNCTPVTKLWDKWNLSFSEEEINTYYFNLNLKSQLDTCTNAVGTLDKTPFILCGEGKFVFKYSFASQISYPTDTLIFVISTEPNPNQVAAGIFIRLLSSNSFDFDLTYMNFNRIYYGFVILGKVNGKGSIDFQGGCVQVDGPVPFVCYQNPTPNAGLDDTVCGTFYELKGIQSIPGSNLNWHLISGGSVNITDDAAATTAVNTNGQYGTFLFEMTEVNNNCWAKDTVSITFNPSPFIAVYDKVCVNHFPPLYPYLATLKIVNGQPPYSILQGNGIIKGNLYITDTLASLVNFYAQIKDANGCESNLVIDTYNCDCGRLDGGRLDSSLTQVCTEQCVSIKSKYDVMIDSNDLVMYILHQSSWNDKVQPSLDTFYHKTDLICFDSTKMYPGKTYYVTQVVGRRIPNTYLIDRTDPCTRASNNQPIVWYPHPIINAGKDFKQRDLIVKLNATPAQFSIHYWKLISGPGKAAFENDTNPNTRVRVDTYGKYCFQWSANFLGCFSFDTICVEFYKLKTTDPDFPHIKFEDRNALGVHNQFDSLELFTPNLISNIGNSFITITGLEKINLEYTWIDNLGRVVLMDRMYIEPGATPSNIRSPVVEGFYFLVLEINGAVMNKKVCVIK